MSQTGEQKEFVDLPKVFMVKDLVTFLHRVRLIYLYKIHPINALLFFN